jgi:hypothetical protein
MEIPLGFIGTLLLIVAGALALWRRRRAFNRTNEYGVERFPSFGAKVRARIADGWARYFAFMFAAAGVLLLAIEYRESGGWVVLLPALALAFLLM